MLHPGSGSDLPIWSDRRRGVIHVERERGEEKKKKKRKKKEKPF